MQKKKLEENLIFFLAGLEKQNYAKLVEIFHLYEAGKLTKLPKSKQGLMSGRAECATCNFKGLRGLPDETITELLGQIGDKKLELKQLNYRCKLIKELKKMKVEFVQRTSVKNWQQAQEEFKFYANEERLAKEFPENAFTSKGQASPQFVAYCRKAVASKELDVLGTNNTMSSMVTLKNGEVSSRCIFFDKEKPTDFKYSDICSVIPGFPGFSILFGSTEANYTVSFISVI